MGRGWRGYGPNPTVLEFQVTESICFFLSSCLPLNSKGLFLQKVSGGSRQIVLALRAVFLKSAFESDALRGDLQPANWIMHFLYGLNLFGGYGWARLEQTHAPLYSLSACGPCPSRWASVAASVKWEAVWWDDPESLSCSDALGFHRNWAGKVGKDLGCGQRLPLSQARFQTWPLLGTFDS